MGRSDNQNHRKNIAPCQSIESVEFYLYACYTIDI